MDERVERKNYRRGQKYEATHKANREAFVAKAMETIEGRDYFYWLLEMCRVGAQPFVNNALLTAFQCGELNVGQQVQAQIIDVSPSGFLKMLKEKEEERKYYGSTSNTNTEPDLFDDATGEYASN